MSVKDGWQSKRPGPVELKSVLQNSGNLSGSIGLTTQRGGPGGGTRAECTIPKRSLPRQTFSDDNH